MNVHLAPYAFLILSALMYLCGCANNESASPNTQTYQGVGVVRAITESRAHVNIDHEAIDGFMDAMQMFFPVLDSAMLTGIDVADSVEFDIVVENGNYAISSIAVLQGASQ